MLMLAFVLFIEIPILLIAWIVKSLSEASDAGTRPGRPAEQPKQMAEQPKPKAEKPKKTKLSEGQMLDIVRAILDDSLLAMDSCYDSLYNEGEAVFSAPEALGCTPRKFSQQYGSRTWRAIWILALQERFDCEVAYMRRGSFHLYGKEM